MRRGCSTADAARGVGAGRRDPQGDARPAPGTGAAKGWHSGAWGAAMKPSSALRRAVQLKPAQPEAWRALGDHYTALEMRDAADGAYARIHPPFDARSEAHGRGAGAGREPHSRSGSDAARAPEAASHRRRRHPHAGRSRGAHRALSPMRRTCWRAASSWRRVSQPRATTTRWCCTGRTSRRRRSRRWSCCCADEPRNPGYRNLKAAILGRIGEYAASIEHYRSVLADYPNQAKVWMSLGHALKTAGNNAESIDAYLKSIERSPQLGEAYWSLANLKTFRFTPAQTQTMREQLAGADTLARRSFSFRIFAGQGARRCRRVRRVVRALSRRQPPAPPDDPL